MTDEIEKAGDALAVHTDEPEDSKARLARLVSGFFGAERAEAALQRHTAGMLDEIDNALLLCGLERAASGEIIATAYPGAASLLSLDHSMPGRLTLRTSSGQTVLSVLVGLNGIVVPGTLSTPERSYDYRVEHIIDAIADVFELRLEQKRHAAVGTKKGGVFSLEEEETAPPKEMP